MRPLEKNPRALATVLMLLIVPQLALIFSRVLTAQEENWLWAYDPIIILGYLGLIILCFFFWRREIKRPNITTDIPKFLLPAILAILILLPLLAFLGFTMPFVRPLFFFSMRITSWGILVLAVIGVPVVTFRGDFSNRQKTVVVLAGLIYLVSPTTGPFFRITGVWSIINTGVRWIINTGLLLAYCILAVLLFAPRATVKARIAFAIFCAGLMLLLQGLGHPTEFGRYVNTYEVRHVIGDVTLGSFPVVIRTANIWVIAGIVILGLLFWLTRAPAPAAKAD